LETILKNKFLKKKKMREISKELRNLNKVWKMKSITSGPPG